MFWTANLIPISFSHVPVAGELVQRIRRANIDGFVWKKNNFSNFWEENT